MQNIIVEADDVWGVFQKEIKSLYSQMKKIAENAEYGVEVFLSAQSSLPNISVFMDDSEVYCEMCVSETDCRATVQRAYDEYLTSKVLNRASDAAGCDGLYEYTTFDEKVEIEDRENELDAAVVDFLDVALDGINICDGSSYDEVIDDIKEHFLEYLARKWEFTIRRPMYLEDGDGLFYEEYPYECMEFEDDNPIYK